MMKVKVDTTTGTKWLGAKRLADETSLGRNDSDFGKVR